MQSNNPIKRNYLPPLHQMMQRYNSVQLHKSASTIHPPITNVRTSAPIARINHSSSTSSLISNHSNRYRSKHMNRNPSFFKFSSHHQPSTKQFPRQSSPSEPQKYVQHLKRIADKQFILEQHQLASQPRTNPRLQQASSISLVQSTKYDEFNPFMRMCAVQRKVVKAAPNPENNRKMIRHSEA